MTIDITGLLWLVSLAVTVMALPADMPWQRSIFIFAGLIGMIVLK